MIIHFIILIFMCYFHVFFMCGRNKYLGSHGILKQVGVNVCCSVIFDSLLTPWAVAHQAPLFMGFSSKNTGVVAIPFSRGSLQPRAQTQVPTLQADSLLPESSRKPVNG